MRAREFISEGNRGQPEESFSRANPGAVSPRGMDNPYTSRFYDFYRQSILTGMDPDDLEEMDTQSWASNRPVYHHYTPEERDKHERVMKKLGHKVERHTDSGSNEMIDINKMSSLKAFKGYPR